MAEWPNPRRKSCAECVKAKRKCGMGLPRCERCSKKDIACVYPDNRIYVSDLNIPELEFPWLDDLMRAPATLPWSGELQSQLPTHPTIPDYLVAQEDPKKTTLSRPETEAAVKKFRTWPDKWLKEGKAPFIHPQLCTSMPKPLMDAYAACAIYSTKTTSNQSIAFDIIEAKATELLRSPNQPFWTPLDLLAAVQALIIFQFIRLFDGDIRQRALAEDAEPILEAWTFELQRRTQEERTFTTVTAPSWRSWVFAESVRRTITMSFFLSGIYSLVKRGFCTVSEQVTANSFTAQRALWAASSELEWSRAKATCNRWWVDKMDFRLLLEEGQVSELDDFGMVMLITYNGRDVIDHWLATKTLVQVPDFQQSLLNVVQLAGTSGPLQDNAV